MLEAPKHATVTVTMLQHVTDFDCFPNLLGNLIKSNGCINTVYQTTIVFCKHQQHKHTTPTIDKVFGKQHLKLLSL